MLGVRGVYGLSRLPVKQLSFQGAGGSNPSARTNQQRRARRDVTRSVIR
jgi:hypothetical protein